MFVFSHEKRSLKLFYLAGFFPLCRQIYRIPGGTFFHGRTFSRFREIGRCKGKVLLHVTLTKYIGSPRSSSTKADERQSQIFAKSEKIFLKSEKIFQIVMFLEIIVEGFIKSEKLLQILIKLLNPEILFSKSKTSLQIQEFVAKSRKIFCKSEKIFCHVLLAPAVSQRQSLFPPFCLSKIA